MTWGQYSGGGDTWGVCAHPRAGGRVVELMARHHAIFNAAGRQTSEFDPGRLLVRWLLVCVRALNIAAVVTRTSFIEGKQRRIGIAHCLPSSTLTESDRATQRRSGLVAGAKSSAAARHNDR
jgi:hypothetical protein